MALEDRDIFMAICQLNPAQPIELIMEQYEKAKRLNMDIEKRICASPPPAVQAVEELVVVEDQAPEEEPLKKKYNRRKLKVKPQDAIKDTAIFCCICGEERQSLTAKHLAGHGISVDDYKILCGYAANQPLMSRQRLAKSQEIIARAQKARMEKRAANEE